jgi:hypothetical protein
MRSRPAFLCLTLVSVESFSPHPQVQKNVELLMQHVVKCLREIERLPVWAHTMWETYSAGDLRELCGELAVRDLEPRAGDICVNDVLSTDLRLAGEFLLTVDVLLDLARLLPTSKLLSWSSKSKSNGLCSRCLKCVNIRP